MKYFYSVLEAMNNRIKELIDSDIISISTNISILGVDYYSFAIRTLLEHRGFNVCCYMEEDEAKRDAYKKKVRGICARYFNKTDEYIHVYSFQEWRQIFENTSIILYVSRQECEDIKSIKGSYCLYDWNNNEYSGLISKCKEITLDELKSIEKDILLYFDKFCEENNLRYWVSGGTMLGALRHKGFIPWDDDIDVFMPDVDYDKFIDIFRENEIYKCHIVDDKDDVWGHFKFSRLINKKTLFVESDIFYRHYLGVNIEILPIVGMPYDREERISYIRKYDEMNKLRTKYFYDCDGNLEAFLKKCEMKFEKLTPPKFDESEYVGVLGTGYYEKDCTSHAVYENTLRIPFEDIMVNVPQGYQEYLDNLYGKGWEELPLESARTVKHNFEAYWL